MKNLDGFLLQYGGLLCIDGSKYTRQGTEALWCLYSTVSRDIWNHGELLALLYIMGGNNSPHGTGNERVSPVLVMVYQGLGSLYVHRCLPNKSHQGMC